jgi:hypothetical protein
VSRSPADDLSWAEEWVASRRWQEAVTYRETAPHEYTVRKWMPDHVDEYRRFAQLILDRGYDGAFWSQVRKYLDVGSHRYWLMTTDVNESEVINRQPLSYQQPGFRRLSPDTPTDTP